MGKKSLQTFNLPENIIMMSKEDFMMNYMTYNEDEDEYYFKKLDGKDLVYICQGSVGGDWVKEQLENKEKAPTHVLLSYDTSVRGRKQKSKGQPRKRTSSYSLHKQTKQGPSEGWKIFTAS